MENRKLEQEIVMRSFTENFYVSEPILSMLMARERREQFHFLQML